MKRYIEPEITVYEFEVENCMDLISRTDGGDGMVHDFPGGNSIGRDDIDW